MCQLKKEGKQCRFLRDRCLCHQMQFGLLIRGSHQVPLIVEASPCSGLRASLSPLPLGLAFEHGLFRTHQPENRSSVCRNLALWFKATGTLTPARTCNATASSTARSSTRLKSASESSPPSWCLRVSFRYTGRNRLSTTSLRYTAGSR